MSSLLATLAAWFVAELLPSLVPWEARVLPTPIAERPRRVDLVTRLVEAARQVASMSNGAFAVGILGGVYAASLGAGGGWSRVSWSSSIRGGLVGLFSGAAIGVCLPFLLFPIFDRLRAEPSHPVLPLVIHSIIYTAICGLGGLAFGCGTDGTRGAARGFAAATMGAMGGTMLFHLVHSYWFPLEWDFSPLPGTALSRLLILLSAGLSAAICSSAVLSAPRDGGGKRPAATNSR